MGKIDKGTQVEWDWGNCTGVDRVQSRFEKSVMRTIKGTKVTRNGSVDDPALYIKQKNGDAVLKRASEVRKTKRFVSGQRLPAWLGSHSTPERPAMTDHKTTHDADEDIRNRDIQIYVNGDIVHRDAAKVSVYDAGFMLGDGIWEGMRLYDGVWAFFDEHMDRFFASCKTISLDVGMDGAGIADAMARTQAANDMHTDVHCRLMLTRGIKDKPFQHPALSTSGPTLVIIMEHSKPVNRLQSAGIRLATVPQVRGLPHSQDPKLNSHSKLNCIIGCLQAEAAGADEALMLDPHGFVNTTNACNFFIVRRGAVWTSTGDYCMNGVTRQKVIDLCRADGIEVYEKNFSLYEAHGAEEAFLTGTFGAQTPVASIDGKPVGGMDRPVTARLQQLHKELVGRHVAERS